MTPRPRQTQFSAAAAAAATARSNSCDWIPKLYSATLEEVLFEAGLIRICLDVSPSASVAACVSCWPILVAEQVLVRQRYTWLQRVLDPTERNGRFPGLLIRIGCIYLERWDVEEV